MQWACCGDKRATCIEDTRRGIKFTGHAKLLLPTPSVQLCYYMFPVICCFCCSSERVCCQQNCLSALARRASGRLDRVLRSTARLIGHTQNMLPFLPIMRDVTGFRLTAHP